MKDRPWIWIIVANIAFMAGLTSLVVIAIRYAPQPIAVQKGAAHGR